MNWKAFWITWLIIIVIALIITGMMAFIGFLVRKNIAQIVIPGLMGVAIFWFIYAVVERSVKKEV